MRTKMLAAGVLGCVAGIVGVVCGIREVRSVVGEPRVGFHPHEYRNSEPVLAHEAASIHVTLLNYEDVPLTLTRIYTDCPCAVVKSNQRGGVVPIELPAKGAVPIELALEPLRTFGRRQFVVTAEVVGANGAAGIASMVASLHVSGGMRAFPSVIDAFQVQPGASVERDVDLFDAYPGDGWSVDSWEVSDEEMLRVESVDEFQRIQIAQFDALGVNPRADFVHRQKLCVIVTAPSVEGRRFSGWVRLRPVFGAQEMPPVLIRVEGSTQAPELDFAPSALVVNMTGAQAPARRRVWCRVRPSGKEDAVLTALRLPDYVRVDIQTNDDGDGWLIECEFDPTLLGRVEREDDSLAFRLTTSTREVAAQLPITVINSKGGKEL